MADKLTQTLERFEKTFEDYKKEFARDGHIDASEAVILKSVHAKIVALRKKVDARNREKGVVDFSDEPLVVTVPVMRYDDSRFRSAFDQSIRNWTMSGDIALNRVHAYFISTDKPEDLSVSDILTVVTLVIPMGKGAKEVIGTIGTITSLVKAAYKATLPSTPSLNDVHRGWSEALRSWGASNHDVEYLSFVKEWKQNNGIGKEVDEVPVDSFLPACNQFADRYLPTATKIEQAFLTQILSKVDDGLDWDRRGDLGDAGVADITMLELAGNFSKPRGDLDDVNEQLLDAVKTVWAKDRVVDLPVQINFSIENVMGAEMAVIQRKSRTPGDTNFKLTSGDKQIFDAFMATKAWAKPMVKDLTVD